METITVSDWTGEVVVNREQFTKRWDDARISDIKRMAIWAKDFDQSVCVEIDQIEARLNEIKAKLVDDSFNDSLINSSYLFSNDQ
jgi:CTP:phosphocholine cytidylyltransferase-like protein